MSDEKKPFNQIEYMNEFNRQAYDRLTFVIPKGMKPKLKEYCAAHGVSMNGFVSDYIMRTLYEAGMLEPKSKKENNE